MARYNTRSQAAEKRAREDPDSGGEDNKRPRRSKPEAPGPAPKAKAAQKSKKKKKDSSEEEDAGLPEELGPAPRPKGGPKSKRKRELDEEEDAGLTEELGVAGPSARPKSMPKAKSKKALTQAEDAGLSRPLAPPRPMAELKGISQSKGKKIMRDGEDVGPSEPLVLARVEHTVDVQYGQSGERRAARLTSRLRVEHEAHLSHIRLGYHVQFFLTVPSEGEGVEEAEEQEVGYLHSWRMAKAMTSKPSAARNDWIAALLRPKLNNIKKSQPMLYETGFCMQALFDREGEPREEIRTDEARDALREGVIFVSIFVIRDEHHGRGIARHALQSYNTLLGRLPEWYAFSGALVLVPGKPEEAPDRWEGMPDKRVEEMLQAIYEHAGGYQVWRERCGVQTAPGVHRMLLVMGRTVTHDSV